jgi:hypothetical protein
VTLASVAVEEALLLLKIGFLVLLYLFIWRVVRTASRDLRVPQESMILPAHATGRRGKSREYTAGRLVALAGPGLDEGNAWELDSVAVTVGRDPANTVALPDDEYASTRHAQVEPRRDGVWVTDVGSTNGTYVNGERVSEPTRLRPGDVILVGETELRYER